MDIWKYANAYRWLPRAIKNPPTRIPVSSDSSQLTAKPPNSTLQSRLHGHWPSLWKSTWAPALLFFCILIPLSSRDSTATGGAFGGQPGPRPSFFTKKIYEILVYFANTLITNNSRIRVHLWILQDYLKSTTCNHIYCVFCILH